MALFRRTPKGKHALGAAVTSIPSGPMRVAAPLMAAVQPDPAPAAPPAPAEPSVMTSISELIASGEAWASDLEDFHALHTTDVSPDGPPPVAAGPVPAVVEAPVTQAARVTVPVAPVPLPPVQVSVPQAHVPPAIDPVPGGDAPAPVVPEAVLSTPATALSSPASARTSLEAALADLLPQQQEPTAGEAYAPPSAPRVQLGFRDGTSASLDPDSEQALALELLAQSLTRRD